VLVETGQAMLNQMKEVEGTSILDRKMHEGETAMIGIPPSAAYGDNVSRIYAQVFCPKTIHLFLEILLRFLICTYDRLR